MTIDSNNRKLVPIHFIDQDTLKDLGDDEIDADALGKIYLWAVEYGLPADVVLQAVLGLGLEAAKRGERP